MRQLSGTDTLMLYADRPHAQNVIGPIGIYDPTTAPGGRVTYDDVLRYVEARLEISGSFRERLITVPLGLDRPFWINDPDFDLEYHVRHIALPSPGDWDQLCTQIARIGARPLDLTRPPWELYVIDGLSAIDGVPAGSFATFLRMHHAAVDGVAGAELLSALHDRTADGDPAPPAPADPWKPEPVPSTASLLARAGIHALVSPFTVVRTVAPMMRSMPPSSRQLLSQPPAGPTNGLVDATRFNGMISAHRSFGATNIPLIDVKTVKNAFVGATVNDVAVAIVGGAMRAYLQDKCELPTASLLATMPISVRPTMTQQASTRTVASGKGGNAFSMATVTLGTNTDDPRERMRIVQAATGAAKEQGVSALRLMEMSELVPGAIMGTAQRAIVRATVRAGRALGSHTIVTNVPGPQVPLYFCGARAVTMTGMAPIVDGTGLIHGIGGYGGEIPICFTADRDALPDPRFYEDCIRRSFDDLHEAAVGSPPIRTTRTRRRSTM